MGRRGDADRWRRAAVQGVPAAAEYAGVTWARTTRTSAVGYILCAGLGRAGAGYVANASRNGLNIVRSCLVASNSFRNGKLA